MNVLASVNHVVDQATIGAFLAVFARASSFLYLAPITSDHAVPARARLALAATIGIALAGARPGVELAALPAVLPAELLMGALAGFAARIAIAGAEAGGQLIGMQFGLGFAASFDPSVGEPSMVTRRLVLVLAGLAFLAAGGLEASVRVIATAPADVDSIGAALLGVIDRSGDVLVLGLRCAAPAIVAGLIANLGLAVTSRAAPSLNVFSVSLAALLVIGGITLIASAPALIGEIDAISRSSIDAMQGVLR
jgi:flagellar biosynthetic protein FliR